MVIKEGLIKPQNAAQEVSLQIFLNVTTLLPFIHFLLLIKDAVAAGKRGNPDVVHMGYKIPSVCSGLAQWSQQLDVPRTPPDGGDGEHPHQMPKLPQLDPLNLKEQRSYSDLFMAVQLVLSASQWASGSV